VQLDVPNSPQFWLLLKYFADEKKAFGHMCWLLLGQNNLKLATFRVSFCKFWGFFLVTLSVSKSCNLKTYQ
jgi:hypothetical protein